MIKDEEFDNQFNLSEFINDNKISKKDIQQIYYDTFFEKHILLYWTIAATEVNK